MERTNSPGPQRRCLHRRKESGRPRDNWAGGDSRRRSEDEQLTPVKSPVGCNSCTTVSLVSPADQRTQETHGALGVNLRDRAIERVEERDDLGLGGPARRESRSALHSKIALAVRTAPSSTPRRARCKNSDGRVRCLDAREVCDLPDGREHLLRLLWESVCTVSSLLGHTRASNSPRPRRAGTSTPDTPEQDW